jgi:hypothetical protein
MGLDNMRKIIVVQPHSFMHINGNMFYLEELAQCLQQQYKCTVYVYNISKIDRTNLYERYTYITQETLTIDNNDVLLADFSGLDSLLTTDPTVLDRVSYCLIMNSATTHIKIKHILGNHLNTIYNNRTKFYLLVEKGYETTTETFCLFRNKILYYTRGFYFNNYVPFNNINTIWYLHNDLTTGAIHNVSIQYIQQICEQQGITYVEKAQSYNPAKEYAGLLYMRKKDYMPRLPYEFWYYDKPVMFFDLSDGLLRKTNTLVLHTPTIRKDLISICSLYNIISFINEV